MKYKCRPADPAYHDDPYYTREIEIECPLHPRADHAARYCEERCHERSEYEPFDVQVLTPEGWITYEVDMVSVPEFYAKRKRGDVPAPDLFRCHQCEGRYEMAELEPNCSDLCRKCFAASLEDD